MKLFTKILAMLLVLVSVVGLVACQPADPANTNTGANTPATGNSTPDASNSEPEVDPADWSYPLNSDTTITVWRFNREGLPTETYRDGLPVYSDLERVVGVDIEWQGPVAGADGTQALELLWYEDELPMIVHGYIQASHLDQMLEDGLIWDLTDYLPIYAPDIWDYYQNELGATGSRMVTSGSGAYAMIAPITPVENSTWIGPIIRQDWLDECKLDMPVTIEDWEKVLTTFKEKYDCNPLSFQLAYANNCGAIASGFGAYEFMGAGLHRDENDKYIVGYETEEWVEMMTVMQQWWANGLFDEDCLNIDEATLISKVVNDQVGITIMSGGAYGRTREALIAAGEDPDQLVALAPPRTEPGAPTTKTSIAATPIGNYNFVITTGATEEEMIECLKLLNYGFTEDGINMYNYGLEGENFEFNDDGSINWLRGVETRGYYKGGLASVNLGYLEDEWKREYVRIWSENTVADQHVMFTIPMTTEEFDVYAGDWGACAGYLSEEAVKFLTGARSMDEYDEFIEGLHALNSEGVLEVWNAAYDRFKAGEATETE